MKQYVVDAFTDKIFSGNPAAVCVSSAWLPDHLMQQIAAKNNLSETGQGKEKHALSSFSRRLQRGADIGS